MDGNNPTCWQESSLVNRRWWCDLDGGAEPPGSCQTAGGLDWPQLPRFPVPPSPSPRLILTPANARATVQSVSTVLTPRGTIWQRPSEASSSSYLLLLPLAVCLLSLARLFWCQNYALPPTHSNSACSCRPVCLPESKCALFARRRACRPRGVEQHACSSTHPLTKANSKNYDRFLILITATCP